MKHNNMHDLLTVLIQTSPIPSHPSTALLEALFRSFDKVEGLKEQCRIIILCDGCEAEPNQNDDHYNGGSGKTAATSTSSDNLKHGKVVSPDVAQRYQEHLELLESQLHQEPFSSARGVGKPGSVELLKLPYRHGSAKAIEAAFFTYKVIQTPYVMIAQHDNFFIESVPLPSILNAVVQQEEHLLWLKCIHFISTATQNYRDKVQKRYGIHLEPKYLTLEEDISSTLSKSGAQQGGKKQQPNVVPLIPLVFWYGRTHIARTDYYTDFVLNRRLKVGDHLEELLGVTQLEDMKKLYNNDAAGRQGQNENNDGISNTNVSGGASAKAHHDHVYGNYVLDHLSGREVLYHLSGRRARAVKQEETNTTTTDDISVVQPEQDKTTTNSSTTQQPQHNPISCTTRSFHQEISSTKKGEESSSSSSSAARSWTTARSCRAIVPGLEIIPTVQETRSSSNIDKNDKPSQKRFRQRCFHCGIKGHSYRFCPTLLGQQQPQHCDDDEDKLSGTIIPNTKTIDL